MSAQRRPIADPRSLERYIRGQVIPRFITRLREIEDGFVEHRMALARRYVQIERLSGGDERAFEARWRAVAERWDFRHLNELIRQHNEYYPIERNLPVDPRTGEYLTSAGRPYRREPLGPEWILERFPPVARSAALGATTHQEDSGDDHPEHAAQELEPQGPQGRRGHEPRDH